MMRLLYLHGLASSKESNTSKVLRDFFVDDEILSIDIPPKPYDAFNFIFKVISEFHPHIIVGTSLGGFYASLFEGPIKILINPALRPDEELPNIINFGVCKYLKEREDGIQTFTFTQDDVNDFKGLRKTLESVLLDIENINQTYAFFGSDDEVVNDSDFFNKNYSSSNNFKMDNVKHRLTSDEIKEHIVPFILQLKEKLDI